MFIEGWEIEVIDVWKKVVIMIGLNKEIFMFYYEFGVWMCVFYGDVE